MSIQVLKQVRKIAPVTNGAGKTGKTRKTGKMAFLEIRAAKPGKRYLSIASRLEELEKPFPQILRCCYIGYFVYTR